MQTHVLTLIAPAGTLPAAIPARIRAALQSLGAETGATDWLSAEEAADIPFAGLAPEQADAAARQALEGAAVDVIAQGAEGRRKRILLADMDSTIVTSETLDEIAAFAGVKEAVAAITKRSMNGEIDFSTALRERVAMLEGLDTGALEKVWAETHLTDGAESLIRTMVANGATCALVSGGFTWFTGRVAAKVGFQRHHANVLIERDGKLTGEVGEPILDREAKLATLKAIAAELSLPLSATAAVGDGANDLAMIGAAGLGVAFRAKPIVAASARAKVDHCGLAALLFAQGYKRAEFAA